MTAHWLAQMGWQVAWLVDTDPAQFQQSGAWRPATQGPAGVATRDAQEVQAALAAGTWGVLDVSTSAQYVRGHIAGATWVLRGDLAAALRAQPGVETWVVVCPDGVLSAWAVAELADQGHTGLCILRGGMAAWLAAGLPVTVGETALFSPRIDRYRRPYEGTDAPREAMQAYLDWEFGLVAQLAADATHGFAVLPAA